MKFFRSIILIAVLSLFAPLLLSAQYKVHFNVSSNAKPHPGDTLFIAGNFNNWQPGANALVLKDISWQLDAKLDAGTYEYKFTRGSWNKVEVKTNGSNTDNHVLKLQSDTVVNLSIEGWSDDFKTEPKKHTASSNVTFIDSFYMPQLKRYRKIWIYLPKEYTSSKKRYPVLYMHDGQNLFDEFTSGFGEWGVDESLDSIIEKENKPSIVVGIENGEKRLNEYNPYSNARFGEGEGKLYSDFLVNTLKPYIDKHYRTLSSKEFNTIAGSSMGGLISYYTAITKSQVFGKAGIFSPSFWIAPEMLQLTDSLGPSLHSKLFFYMGEAEGEAEVQKMEAITTKLGTVSSSLIYSAIDPDGQHNEKAWRKWFPEFYRWIMADWTNYIIRPKN